MILELGKASVAPSMAKQLRRCRSLLLCLLLSLLLQPPLLLHRCRRCCRVEGMAAVSLPHPSNPKCISSWEGHSAAEYPANAWKAMGAL